MLVCVHMCALRSHCSDCTEPLSSKNFAIATKQLQTIVMKLVKESFGDTHYAKALECIKVLREEAIKVSNSIGTLYCQLITNYNNSYIF